jgi:hypothetical protein
LAARARVSAMVRKPMLRMEVIRDFRISYADDNCISTFIIALEEEGEVELCPQRVIVVRICHLLGIGGGITPRVLPF